MTAGSFNRNTRTPTMGRYSGPYTIGLLASKTWSGDNQPSVNRNRSKVVPLYESVRTSVYYRKVYEKRKAIRYVWSYRPLSAIPSSSRRRFQLDHPGSIPVYSDAPGRPLRGFKIRVPVEREYIKVLRVPVTVTTVKMRKYYGDANMRPPKRARYDEHFFTCTWNFNTNGIVNYTVPGVGNFSNATNAIISSYTVSPAWSSNDDLKLIDKLRTRVAGSDFNAGIALGESHKTLELITSSATKIYQALRAVKRGDVVSAANYLAGRRALGARRTDKSVRASRRTIQENWLQLQYGWRPLVDDVYNGAQFLAHQLNSPIQQTLRVSRELGQAANFSGTAGWKYSKSNLMTRSSIKALIKEKNVPALAGLQDPASVAWELVPYSFVADWFIPIGSYLSARGLSQSLTGTFVTSTKSYENHAGLVQYGQNITGLSQQGDVQLLKGTFTRSVSSSLQIPLPSWKPLGKVASWMHCANAVALLTSFLR